MAVGGCSFNILFNILDNPDKLEPVNFIVNLLTDSIDGDEFLGVVILPVEIKVTLAGFFI